MKYKKSDLSKVFQELGSLEKIEDIRVRAAEIQKDLEADYNEHEDLVNANEQLKNDVNDLQNANYKLFKMVGNNKDEDIKDKNLENEDTSNLTYDKLFDENGGLK